MRFYSDDLQLKMNGKPILELEIMYHENDWSKSYQGFVKPNSRLLVNTKVP
jgi:hypothetical protein